MVFKKLALAILVTNLSLFSASAFAEQCKCSKDCEVCKSVDCPCVGGDKPCTVKSCDCEKNGCKRAVPSEGKKHH